MNMKKAVIYIHGKGGNAGEAARFKTLFPERDVLGFDYRAQTPWEAKDEFTSYFAGVCEKYDSVWLIAESIGAFFAMQAGVDAKIGKAYFISPVVDMEKLVADMLVWENATENELKEKKEIKTASGETLSWDYLLYVRENPVQWSVPTRILYGENDALTSFETISGFARKNGAELCVMPDGEHWFHTTEQLEFLYDWMKKT